MNMPHDGGVAMPGVRMMPTGLIGNVVVRQFLEASEVASCRSALPLTAGSVSRCMTVSGATFSCDIRVFDLAGHTDAFDVRLAWRLQRGIADQVNVGFELDWPDWSTGNYVLMPGAVYDGNRFPLGMGGREYPPMFAPSEAVIAPQEFITDVPRLNTGDGPSLIQLRAGDMATPCIGVFAPRQGLAMLLLTEPRTGMGEAGLQIRESADRSSATMVVEAPCMRSEGMYVMLRPRHPSVDRAPCWREGDGVVQRLLLFSFRAASVQDLFDRFATVRKILNDGDASPPQAIPYSAAWFIQEKKHNRENWCPPGCYSPEVLGDTGRPWRWQLGWVGGGMSSLPLLIAGGELSRARAVQTVDWMIAETQAPSGLLVGIVDAHGWHGDGFDRPGTDTWVMTRKNADALYFLMRHLLFRRHGADAGMLAAWGRSVRRLADCFVAIWERHGQVGQFLDYMTGDIVVGGSTAGALVPAGLALAAKYFQCDHYLDAGRAIAKGLCERYVRRGLTTGGPGEILSSPDSESAFALLESLVVLWEVTGRDEWLAWAGKMARQAATWVHSYDYAFSPESPFGKLAIKTTGSVWANVQNKHSAPAICTLSGSSLFRLYRATGDPWFRELCRDIVRGIPQYLSRDDRPIEMLPTGWMCERVNTCDWEYSWCPPGHVFRGSCWCEVSCMLAYVDMPGIYVDADSLVAESFDHVDVLSIGRDAQGIAMEVGNVTGFDAAVRLLIETGEMRRSRLAEGDCLRWPVIHVPANQRTRIQVPCPSDGVGR